MIIMATSLQEKVGTKRRRLESSMSTTSAVSNQTQVTDISLDSDNASTLVKCSTCKSQTDVRNQIVLKPRRKPSSSRPGSYSSDLETDGGNSIYQQTRPKFSLGNGQGRYRRNTENSINTTDLDYIQPTGSELHRSTTTPCVPGQLNVSPISGQSPTSFPNIGSGPTMYQYDNNGTQVRASQSNISTRSQNNEHDYMSLGGGFEQQHQPVRTVVNLNERGETSTVRACSRPLLNSEGSTDSQTSSNSYGYCAHIQYDKTKKWRYCGNNILPKAFVILLVFNIIFIIALAIIVANLINNARQPEKQLPNCFEYEQVQELIEDPGSSALFRQEVSGLYCLELAQVARRTRKEKCRPAIELKGTFDGEREERAQFQWDGDHSCGLQLSADKSYIEIKESGLYFLFSRIHFSATGESDGMVFPVGHALNKNNNPMEKITQICRAQQTFVQHASVLETIKGLKVGEKISVQVEGSSGSKVMRGNVHTLGIFKL